jgi:diphosphomevalonate decarboxylase
MKATAIAPSNIAFIKYWGKENKILRTPLNSSISMNLTGAYTTTTVEFSDHYEKDIISIEGGFFSTKEEARVVQALDRIRKKSGMSHHARVVTHNTFPKGAGAAASASGFAALAVAGFAAAGVSMSEKDLTIFARMGSGSACRSIPDGFVLWEKGNSSDTSYAYSLYPHDYWDLRDILVIVDMGMKKVSTTEGMESVSTSPKLTERLFSLPDKITAMREALKEKNFPKLGEMIEGDCLNMHEVMETQEPPLVYRNETTQKITSAVIDWRKEGLSVYFTIDAGPNVHLICEASEELKVIEKLKNFPGVLQVIINKPAPGAHIVHSHLF